MFQPLLQRYTLPNCCIIDNLKERRKGGLLSLENNIEEPGKLGCFLGGGGGLFWLFRVAPEAYESFQARGRIRAAAASLQHSYSNTGSEPLLCDLHCSSWQCQVLNPLSKARDWTVSSWILVGFITAEPQWEFQNQQCFKWSPKNYNHHHQFVQSYVIFVVLSFVSSFMNSSVLTSEF